MKKSFDHLLRETLQGPAPEPPDGCLDAGVLAAWFEGTLDPGERGVAEAHAAQCSRCQAALAAMIRSEPPIESRPWWRSAAFGWLVPITVAAAALVIFIQPYRHRTAPEVAVQQAPAAIAAPAEEAPLRPETLAGNAAVPATRPPAPAVQARSRDVSRFEPAAKAEGGAPAPASTPAVPPASVEVAPLKDRVGVPIDNLTLQKAASAAVAAPAPPPAASEPRSVIATGPPPAPSASPTRPVEDRSAGAQAMTEKSVAETVLLSRTAATQQPPLVVRSPGGSTEWRIVKPGSVQRSNDAGATWETQAAGVSAVITSGAAPSDSVCWLVGKSGVVLQSTDGRSWRRVPFPQAVDLISVVATDATTATVVAAGGRTFRTTDGGRTWK